MSIAMTADGMIQVAVPLGDDAYISVDYGATWNTLGVGTRNWYGCSMSSDGRIVLLGPASDNLYLLKAAVYQDSDVQLDSGIRNSVRTITISTTLDSTFHIVLCNSAAAITVTLPAVASSTGRKYTIININTGVVTIDGNLAETINGVSSYDLVAQYTGISLSCNGSAYFTHDYDPSRIYSTTETNTGKIWIDGKSIYRRAFTGTTDNDTDTLLWTDASDTIDNLIDCNATLKKSSAGGRWSTAGNQDDAYISMYCQEPSGDLRLFHTNAGAQGIPYLAWIEYT
jgi:hypothetical protein